MDMTSTQKVMYFTISWFVTWYNMTYGNSPRPSVQHPAKATTTEKVNNKSYLNKIRELNN